MTKIARDMSETQFAEACARYGFIREGFMGYYRLPGPGHTCVSVWNAGERRRDQLAYLIRENEKCQRNYAAKLLRCGGCGQPFDDEDRIDYATLKWHPACVEKHRADLVKTRKYLGTLNAEMGKFLAKQ